MDWVRSVNRFGSVSVFAPAARNRYAANPCRHSRVFPSGPKWRTETDFSRRITVECRLTILARPDAIARYLSAARSISTAPRKTAPRSGGMNEDLLWHRQRAPQHGAHELLRLHRLGEQQALREIETHLAHGDEVGPALDAFGDRARSAG